MIALRDLVLATERYRLRVARASLGTGVIEMIALGNLAAEGPSTPTQMARRPQLATASVTALIDRLEHLGLVARRRHRTDRRKVVVDLSETGHNAARTGPGPARRGTAAMHHRVDPRATQHCSPSGPHRQRTQQCSLFVVDEPGL
jgi:DNA-binding MarR family transcriptional regulator